MLTKNTFHEHLYGTFSSFLLAEISMKPYQSPLNRGNFVRNIIVLCFKTKTSQFGL